MSSTIRPGASKPCAPQSFRNPLTRLARARQQRQAATAERQVQAQYLRAQEMYPEDFAQPAPTRPTVAYSGMSRDPSGSGSGLPGAPRHTDSGSAHWQPDAFTSESRGLRQALKHGWRRTQKVARGGARDGVSKRRYWKGIAMAGCVGLAAGMLILSAFHIAVAALAIGCIGFMGFLGWAAFKRQTA